MVRRFVPAPFSEAPDSVSSSSSPPSFSDDLVILCKVVLEAVHTLSASHCIQIPPSTRLILTNALTSIVSILLNSGVLVLSPNITLDWIRSSASDYVLGVSETDCRHSLFNIDFVNTHLHRFVNASGVLLVAHNSSFASSSGSATSDKLRMAAISVVNSSSHRSDVDALFGFEEWIGVMTKCAAKTEVLNDLSFLRLTCFRSTLVRLQSKYQAFTQLPLSSDQSSPNSTQISPFDPTLDWNTSTPSLAIQSSFSLNTVPLSNSSPDQSPLEYGSERSDVSLPNHPPSNSSISSLPSQQEALTILTVLHSLIAAPLTQASPLSNPPPQIPIHLESDFSSISHQPINLKEKFSPRIFDEVDEETLLHSILRCHRLCQVVSPLQSIVHMEQFVEGLTALLEHRNRNLQSAATSLLFLLMTTLQFGTIHHKLFFSLRHAFRERSNVSQFLLLNVAAMCRLQLYSSAESPDDPFSDFDWDGMIHLDFMDDRVFQSCVVLLCVDFRRVRVLSNSFAESLFVGLEKNQHAISRIVSILTDELQNGDPVIIQPYFIFSLILSFFFRVTLPDPLIQSLWQNFGSDSLSFIVGYHPSFLLNHTSSNCKRHRHTQQPFLMELLCERLVRFSPHAIFERECVLLLDKSPLFLSTPLFGLHPLSSEASFPIPTSFTLRIPFMSFSESSQQSCLATLWDFKNSSRHHLLRLSSSSSLHQRVASTQQKGCDLICTSFCFVFSRCVPRLENAETVLDLHWLSIPVSFDSPLLAITPSINGISLTAKDFWISDSHLFQKTSFEAVTLATSRRMKDVSKPYFRTWLRNSGMQLTDLKLILSPSPAIVSVVLESLARLVRVSSDCVRMELVWRGVLDVVIVSVSSSLFLEDYENGIALIGTLLGTIRREYFKRHVTQFRFDISPFL
ncbi:hypothetical protein BLNAU_5605 [Blattamonas nauphoetae]|uniref:Uncharacterized protein n=1 Tax=Blattamonas nauphoetae TaxID=2049346 RepID=A0ABQ9Y753_9EUKA|nr:hypothetical protein BLNAU_5605 [Blattamonas nauphoetae]